MAVTDNISNNNLQPLLSGLGEIKDLLVPKEEEVMENPSVSLEEEEVPLEETFATLLELKEEKKFFQLGVSNFSAWQVMKARLVAEKNGFPNIDILQ